MHGKIRMIAMIGLAAACLAASPSIARERPNAGPDIRAMTPAERMDYASKGGAINAVVIGYSKIDANGNGIVRDRRGNTNDRGCLKSETLAILQRAESHFGTTFALASTCRPRAIVAGTGHASRHRDGSAVDLKVPPGISKQAVVKYLYGEAPGLVMTYRRMSHVHFDIGSYHAIACGGCVKRYGPYAKTRRAGLTHQASAHRLE